MSSLPLFRRYCVVAIPFVFGLTAFGLTRIAGLMGPVVDAPDSYDLGNFAGHEFIDRDIVIRNVGQKDLVLANFHGGCATCIQFGLKSPNGREGIESLTVRPGESVTIAARLSVFGAPNKPFETFFACDTNDPHRPQLEVVFKAIVRGRIIPLPPILDFAEVEPGQTARQRIELYDTGRGEPFQFGRIECPPNIHASFIDGGQNFAASGKLVGTLEVCVSAPPSRWSLDGKVQIYEKSRAEPTVTLPVSAFIPSVAEIIPPSAILPRVVGTSNDYTVECRFHSPKGLPVTVYPENAPEELVLTLLAPAEGDGPGYRIEWRASAIPRDGTIRAVTVLFSVEAGGRKETIEVPVRCRSTM